MTWYCDECNKKVGHELPYDCRRCGNRFCDDCHLPEDHNCPGLKGRKTFFDPVIKQKKHRVWHQKSRSETHKKTFKPKKNKQTHKQTKNKHWVEHVGHRPEHIKDARKEQKKSLFERFRNLIIFIILLLLIAVLIYAKFSAETDEKPVLKTEAETPQIEIILEEVPVTISLSKYASNPSRYADQNLEVIALLKHGSYTLPTGSGVYTEMITDYSGNDIRVTGLTSAQRRLFEQKTTSKEKYVVSGTLRNLKDGLTLDVNEITEYVPEMRTVTVTPETDEVMVQESEPVQKKSSMSERNSVAIGKIKSFFGELKDNTVDFFSSSKEKISELSEDTGLTPAIKSLGCEEGYHYEGDDCIKTLYCNDGTQYGKCSYDKPKYCDDGKLVERINECGCPRGASQYEKECISTELKEARQALDYVNRLRVENGRKELAWNDNLYALGLFRSKDMYNRNYFDHVTPEGKCVNDFKAKYELSQYNIAENAGAVYEGYTDFDMKYASYANPSSQVSGWMESRGHRYNLLYPSHEIGTVACYKGACVFLGGNKEYYGLGFGPCTTGEEGMSYWDSAENQPGEI